MIVVTTINHDVVAMGVASVARHSWE